MHAQELVFKSEILLKSPKSQNSRSSARRPRILAFRARLEDSNLGFSGSLTVFLTSQPPVMHANNEDTYQTARMLFAGKTIAFSHG